MYSKQKQRKNMIRKYDAIMQPRVNRDYVWYKDLAVAAAPIGSEVEKSPEPAVGLFQRVKNWFTK